MKVRYNKEGIGNQFLFDVAKSMSDNHPDKVEFRDNKMIFPESIGSGNLSYHKLDDDIEITVHNHTFKIPMHLEQAPTAATEFYAMYVNLGASGVTCYSEDANKKINRSKTSAVLWSASDVSAALEMKPGEAFSGIVVYITKEFLQKILWTKNSQNNSCVLRMKSTNICPLTDSGEKCALNNGTTCRCSIDQGYIFSRRMQIALGNLKYELAQEIVNFDKSSSLPEKLVIKGNIHKILALFVQRFAAKSQRKESSTHFNDTAKIIEIKKLIDDRAASEHISLSDLAKAAAISKTKLKLKFKEIIGETVYQYYLNVKMEKAKEILEDSAVPISNLAYEMGFNSTSHFSQVFKKYHGVSPRTISSQSQEMSKAMVCD